MQIVLIYSRFKCNRYESESDDDDEDGASGGVDVP